MLDALREEAIVNKVGGRFKLSTLIQKRMVALNTGAGVSGQIMGRVRHYKAVPMIGMVVAIGAVATLAWRADKVSILEFEILVALFGFGFGPMPPLLCAADGLQVHHRR